MADVDLGNAIGRKPGLAFEFRNAGFSGILADLAAGMTMVVVTHEMRFAREAADKVVFVDGGVVVEPGTPDEVISHPAPERTRTFLARSSPVCSRRTTDGTLQSAFRS